ncbi:MAG: methylated-DNA--[protein]-cysteine S-methyltransferase [Clostridiales bacterium]|jgi:methylated-DNA-[protein]-cysteine S-methyltransferase|nr:methylated-DNA--[protein]-cysteine S-methyltransferase [Clostridiales bacterium]
MKNEPYAIYDFPCGRLKIGYTDTSIRYILTTTEQGKGEPSSISDLAASQLNEYFSGKRKNFDLPLEPLGTEFQKKVWAALSEIPYGDTRSYKDIADRVGSPKAARAVGGANNKNPLIIVIPCHRVIGANGDLVGYGCGLDMKRFLLELEKENC